MKIKDFKLGATGAHPYGKVDDTDEGEIRLGMAADHHAGIIRIAFGKPIAWLGLPSSVARELALALIAKADELDRRKS